MDSKKLNKFYGKDRDYSQQYAVIGRFIVEFEKICEHIRFNCQLLLQFNGLENWRLTEIIFHHRTYTIEPLFATYRSMASLLIGENKQLQEQFKRIATRIESINKIRNEICHGTYDMGDNIVEVTDQPNPSDFSFLKRVPKKDGTIEFIHYENRSQIEEKTSKVTEVYKEVRELTNEILFEIDRNRKIKP